jgi:3-oxoacyl-[acyl-carrier protein] reductase
MTTSVLDNDELKGRSAFVTGASRNIGRAIACALASQGANVGVGARGVNDDAEHTLELIQACGVQAMLVEADLSDPDAARDAVRRCADRFGGLDILVNNAAQRSDNSIENITPEEWRRVTGSILDASFFAIQSALPFLRTSDMASIINIGGVAGHAGVGGRSHVAAAKAGIAGLTRGIAAELAPDRITVNCIAPGRIETQRSGHVPQHFIDRPTPLGRGGEPEEVGRLAAFVAGPGARYMTGQTIHLNGGWHMA